MSERNASPLQPAEQRPHSGADLPGEIGTPFYIQRLRRFDDGRHGAPYLRRPRARIAHHAGQDVAVEHAMHGNIFSSRFETRHLAHCVHQRFAMMRAGPPNQRAVNIE